MLEELVNRGYKPGGGLISPSGIFYLNIPKNASTYLTNVFVSNGWDYSDVSDTNIKKAIVVLRDPMERWVSGFATYAASWLLGNGYGSDHFVQDYNNLTEKLIFDNLVFDDHTTEQVKFVEQLSNVGITYFKQNGTMLDGIGQYVGQTFDTSSVMNANLSENNYDTNAITKFMLERVNSDPLLKAKIVEAYKGDYDLIRSANYYVTPRI